MKRHVTAAALALTLGLSLLSTSATAVATSLSMKLTQTPSAGEAIVTMYGELKPAKSGIPIALQIRNGAGWEKTRFTTRTTKLGTWRIVAQATARDAQVKYRAKAVVGGKVIYSSIREITIKELPEMATTDSSLLLASAGPGGRIHGVDISRWQHPNDAPIDFVKMYDAGVRFAMIKASDTRDDADVLALKYVVMDHSAAQAAGIYTGFYHYAVLPDVTEPDAIKADALAQAQKVIWRLAALGGYGEKDLMYALDLENNCVRLNSAKSCLKYASRSAVTLWARTFLAEIESKTGRRPFIYSYSNFLESAMARDDELAKYPLWLAQYAIDPFNPLNQPGLKVGGCYVHPWTTANCGSQWVVWQYTSCGIADKYGVPGSRLDLNVFRGSAEEFLKLTQGTWVPAQADLMPINEPTQLFIRRLSASTTDKSVVVEVEVLRPDGRPVVTGTVKFVVDPATPMNPRPKQTVVRATSGQWKLAITGAPAGDWAGKIEYVDVTGTHATSYGPLSFSLTQGPTPEATIKPLPTKKPSTGDGCKNQIKN